MSNWDREPPCLICVRIHQGFISPISSFSIFQVNTDLQLVETINLNFIRYDFTKRLTFSYHSQDYFVCLKPADNFALSVFFHILMFCKSKSWLADAGYFLQLCIVVILSKPQVGRGTCWTTVYILYILILYILYIYFNYIFFVIYISWWYCQNHKWARARVEPWWTHRFRGPSCAGLVVCLFI